MIKKLIFILSLYALFFINFANASFTISNISYDWNLSKDSIININWTDLTWCTNLNIWGKSIKTKEITATKISFNFSDINMYSWNASLTCWTTKINKDFSFPNITKIDWFKSNNFDWTISIFWSGLWEWSIVNIPWWTFTILTQTDWLIVWKLSQVITNSTIYIEKKWLKSNIIDLWMKIPKIKFITSNNNFLNWSKINIYWENLNSYNDFKLYIWTEYITNAIYNKNWYIEATLPETAWNYNVYSLSNWIKSNSLQLNILSNRPEITNIERTIYSDGVKIKVILKEDITSLSSPIIFINWTNIWSGISDWKNIYFDVSHIKKWVNLIEVKFWNLFSNIYSYKESNDELPYINEIEVWWVKSWKRKISLWVSNFDITSDKIYLWWTEIQISSYIAWVCLIWIPENTLSWYFTVWRWSYINNLRKEFDIKYSNLMHVNTLTLSSIKQWWNITITWENLDNATITSTNLFWNNSNWKIDIKQNNTTISWYILDDFNKTSKSSVNITKNWQTLTIWFIPSDIENSLTINWAPLIEKIYNKNSLLIKEWETIYISWKWFYSWDTISIWNTKTQLNITEWNIASFVMPKIWVYWKTSLKITNKNGIESNTIDFILANPTEEDNIKISYKPLDIDNFYIDNSEKLTNPLFKIWVINKVQDVVISKLSFNISDLNKKSVKNLWTFKLQIGTDKYSPTLIDEKWNISFENIYIPKLDTESMILLLKWSDFLDLTNILISVNQNDAIFTSKDGNVISNIIFNWTNQTKINLLSESKQCIDSETTNINCNSYTSQNTTISKPTQNTTNTTNTTTTQNNNIWETRNNNSIVLNINNIDFSTSLMKNLSAKLITLANKLANYDSNKNNKIDIETTINQLLIWFSHYEKSSVNTAKRNFANKIITNQVVNLQKFMK